METLSLAAPLVLFEKSRLRADTGFHLLPSFHHRHPTLHSTITLHKQLHIQSPYPLLPTVHHTDTRPTRNVVCPSGAWFENRPHSTPSIRFARNPKRVIVQWVGIGTHFPINPRMKLSKLDLSPLSIEFSLVELNRYSAKGLGDWLYATLHKIPGEVEYSFCLFLKS